MRKIQRNAINERFDQIHRYLAMGRREGRKEMGRDSSNFLKIIIIIITRFIIQTKQAETRNSKENGNNG